MPISVSHPRWIVLLLAVAVCGCPSQTETEPGPYAGQRKSDTGALLGPLEDDQSEGIVSWVDGEAVTDWPSEVRKRDEAIAGFLDDTDPQRAAEYGFRSGQHPRLGWAWFSDSPVGFGGVPFVLLKTIFDLDPDHDNATLRRIARIWKREAAFPGGPRWTIDHLGFGPHPDDYADGVALPPAERKWPLPYGFVYENPKAFEPLSDAERVVTDGRLLARRIFRNTSLLIAKIRAHDSEEDWNRDLPTFGKPSGLDRVFFSCAGCHVGRVMVSGKMKFLPGMPNTEVEAQYYSKLIMLTAAALVKSGFDPASRARVDPARIEPDTGAIRALYTEMLDKARQRPETIYGPSPAQVARAKLQTLAVADQFPAVMQDLIGSGVKTHFIYQVVARNNSYTADLPDVLEDRPGQMDAFGIASGLVAIHTRRPDDSYLEFIRRDNPDNPIFTGFSTANGLPEDIPGMTEPVSDSKAAGQRIFDNVSAWAPKLPAAIDIKSVVWARDRVHANWDGNQGAASRTLASGTSATGDPRKVNVRIHEPLNPLIDHLPPVPYPFEVDLAKAAEGKALFNTQCASCHKPRNETIYPVSKLGTDPNRTLLNTSVSRFGLAALVFEACHIHGANHAGEPGADWCVPEGDWERRMDDYFRDTPRRVKEGTNGYKADMLHGVWAQAPYLHNGSVPTLAHLICAQTRPQKFVRGNLHFDEALVGFEWAERPAQRYSAHDTILVKEFDTALPGRSNAGHRYGGNLCPDTSGLDPVADRSTIEQRINESQVGALLEYLKTL